MVADPGHGQVRDHLFLFGQVVEGVGDGRRPQHVRLGEHHALGAPGGAGGVEDDGDVVRAALGDLGLPGLRAGRLVERLAAELLDGVEGMQAVDGIFLQAAVVVVDDVLDSLAVFADLQDLVDLLLVLHHGEAHACMIEHEAHLGGHRVLIDRHRDGAQRLGGAHGPVEPRPVIADDRHLVAARQAEPGEAHGERGDLVAHLGPGPDLPDAQVLLAHGRAIGETPGVTQQQLGECVFGCRAVRHRSHGRFLQSPLLCHAPLDGRWNLNPILRTRGEASEQFGAGTSTPPRGFAGPWRRRSARRRGVRFRAPPPPQDGAA